MAHFTFDEFRVVAFRELLQRSVWHASAWLVPLILMAYVTRSDAWFSGFMAGAAGMVLCSYAAHLRAIHRQYAEVSPMYHEPIEVTFSSDGVRTYSSVRSATFSRTIISAISMTRDVVTLTLRSGEPLLIPRSSLSESEMDWIREWKGARGRAASNQ